MRGSRFPHANIRMNVGASYCLQSWVPLCQVRCRLEVIPGFQVWTSRYQCCFRLDVHISGSPFFGCTWNAIVGTEFYNDQRSIVGYSLSTGFGTKVYDAAFERGCS